jgi:ADP-heptose:LPS heptosyltransferase/SAM-dependent methyltransferase
MLDQYRPMGCKNFDDVALLHCRERTAYWMRHFVRHLRPPAKILELGCGLGTFTHFAAQLGFAAEATELSPAWRKIISEKFGIRVSGGIPGAEARQAGALDAVAMFEVLEHVLKPQELLAVLAGELAAGGQLWLQLPCYAGTAYARADAGFTRHLRVGEHIFLYSFASLTKLLDEYGFTRRIRYAAIFPGDMFLVASRGEIPSYAEEDNRKFFCSVPSAIIPYACLGMAETLRGVEAQLVNIVTQSRASIAELAAENAALRKRLEKLDPAALFSVQEPFLASLDYADYSPAADNFAPIEPAGVQRLMYIRLDGIGDCILGNAIFARLPGRFPQAEITVVCDTACSGLFEGADRVARVIEVNRHKLADDAYFRQTVKVLRACKADAVCNFTFSNTPRSFALSLLAGAPLLAVENDDANCAGYIRKIFEVKVNTLIPEAKLLQREYDRNRAVLRRLQLPNDRGPSLALSEARLEAADEAWRSAGIAKERGIVLFVGGLSPLRDYARFDEVLSLLCADRELGVIALGSKREYEASERVLSVLRAKGAVVGNFCGKLPLMTSLAMLRGCELALGVETSFAHAAAALETPHVIVLGGGHFGRFVPYSPYSTVVALPLDCYRCNWQCKYSVPHCIRGITPETLAWAARQSRKTPLPGGGRLVLQPPASWPERENLPRWQAPEAFLQENRKRGKSCRTAILTPSITHEA